MSNIKSIREFSNLYTTYDLTEPILLEEAGKSVAAVISIEEYERYQVFRNEHHNVSATEARRSANQALFGDLVGCALSVDEPLWVPEPTPHWRIPYRSFTGEIVAIISVDAKTGQADLGAETREKILQKVQSLAASIP